jgi:predicted 3-demethylubiquinone-9 3-methyltransferase (glyoxalase superfamily)
MPKITPMLWFDTEAEDAANYYVSVFPNSKITDVSRYPEGGPGKPGSAMVVAFELDGRQFTALNAGPHFKHSEAVSWVIDCGDQAEVDYYWDKLTDGGQEDQCGWVKDRYGLSWQVCPEGMLELLSDPDPARGQRAMQAMFGMKKLDLAALRAAADAA